MTPKPKAQKNFERFLAHQKGTVAVFTAIVAIPMMLAVGTAVDLSRLSAAQTQTQNAVDAAALTGASLKGKTNAERIAAAQKAFASNTTSGIASKMTPVATFEVVDDVMIGNAEIQVPSAFMHLAGLDVMNGNAHAEVNILSDKKAEIVMVLDYSGSMKDPVGGKTKYKVMRDAAIKLVDDLSKSDPDNVKFGLVPFSNHVYTTLPGAFVIGGSGTWTGCTQDRKHDFNLSDATPTTDPASKWNQVMLSADDDPDDKDEQVNYGCDGYIANNLTTVDLTDKFKKVSNQLKIMKPYAYTHIALGVEFGYHMLSPNAPYTEGAAYDDKDTKKFMVVLTDGAQTTGGFGKNGRTILEANKNLAALCTNAKANKITIMTMAFDLDDAPTVQRLKDCSTDPSTDFFVANDAVALESAFESIKAAIASDIYLSN
jgi:Flp pilus assembly protein TadG